jgi:hypothetical protein
MHFLSLYGWKGSFNVEGRPELPAALLDGMDANFNKLTVSTRPNGKERRRTLSKKLDLTSAIRQFPDINWFALDEIADGNFLSARSHMAIDEGRKHYFIGLQTSWEQWALPHLYKITMNVTPVYGFAAAGPVPRVIFYAAGCGTTSMNYDQRKLADSLMHDFILGKRHEEGFMHDLYNLNILSQPHAAMTIGTVPLRDWISLDDRGKLIVINDRVFAWIVPDRVIRNVRETLIKAGIIDYDWMSRVASRARRHNAPPLR